MSFVAIDLGASGTRYTTESGQISVVPNNMVFLGEGTSLINPDTDDIESSLEVQIVKTSGQACEHFPVNVLVGIMAEKHISVNDRPSVLTRKWTQKINYVSAILAAALAKIKCGGDDTFEMYMAVPPIEIHDARVEFSKRLVGSYSVTFHKFDGGKTINFSISDVKCYEESLMASTSFFFTMNGTLKDATSRYCVGNVLSMDIGASTIDLVIIKNGRYIDKSGQTYQIGGNIARDTLMNSISAKYSMDLSVEDAEKVMAEGRLQQGNTYIEVSDLVNEAKQNLAKQLIPHLQTYFKRIGIDVKTVNAVVVSGGGSMQSQYVDTDCNVIKTSEPMSYFVMLELKTWSEGTEVIAYGGDARFANVKGLYIKAKLDEAKRMLGNNASIQKATTPSVESVQPVAEPVAEPVVEQTVVKPVVEQTVVEQPVEQTVAEQPVATEQPVVGVAETV